MESQLLSLDVVIKVIFREYYYTIWKTVLNILDGFYSFYGILITYKDTDGILNTTLHINHLANQQHVPLCKFCFFFLDLHVTIFKNHCGWTLLTCFWGTHRTVIHFCSNGRLLAPSGRKLLCDLWVNVRFPIKREWMECQGCVRPCHRCLWGLLLY